VRHVWITSLSAAARVATHSVFAPATLTGAVHTRATTAAGVWADGATLSASFAAQSAPGAPATTAVATFVLVDSTGAVVASASIPGVAVPGDGSFVPVSANLSFTDAELWSIPRPYLYTLVTSLSVGGATVDAVNTTVGVRSLAWDPNSGLFVNTQPVKMRGFCNHESFAGVGGKGERRRHVLLPIVSPLRPPPPSLCLQLRSLTALTSFVCSRSAGSEGTPGAPRTTRLSPSCLRSRTFWASPSWMKTAVGVDDR